MMNAHDITKVFEQALAEYCGSKYAVAVDNESNALFLALTYVTCAPKVSISGNCTIGNRVYIGTGAVIKEKISICDDVIIGALSFVNKDITEPGTYVGSPVRKIK